MGRELSVRVAAGGNGYQSCDGDVGRTGFPSTPISPEHAKNVSEARRQTDKPVPEPAAFLFKPTDNGSSNPSKGCVRQLRPSPQNRDGGSHWRVVSGEWRVASGIRAEAVIIS